MESFFYFILFLVCLSSKVLSMILAEEISGLCEQKFRKLSLFDQMGLLFSCPFADYDDLRENFEPIVVRSISFNDDNVKTTVRSVSFNGRDAEPKILKSLGSGKMIIEGSVSFRQRDLDSLNLERMISFKVPSLSTPKESAFGSDSFKGIESENQLPASNTLTDANPNAPTSETSRPKHLAAVRLQKVYKSFRTRRRLADCAVLVEQGWYRSLP